MLIDQRPGLGQQLWGQQLWGQQLWAQQLWGQQLWRDSQPAGPGIGGKVSEAGGSRNGMNVAALRQHPGKAQLRRGDPCRFSQIGKAVDQGQIM